MQQAMEYISPVVTAFTDDGALFRRLGRKIGSITGLPLRVPYFAD